MRPVQAGPLAPRPPHVVSCAVLLHCCCMGTPCRVLQQQFCLLSFLRLSACFLRPSCNMGVSAARHAFCNQMFDCWSATLQLIVWQQQQAEVDLQSAQVSLVT